MPHLKLPNTPLGPVIPVGVWLSEAARLGADSNTTAGMQIARALIDTGASASVIDPSIVEPLGIKPVSFSNVHTPSTDGKPVTKPVYDVSIYLIHGDKSANAVWERSFPVMCANLRAQGIDMLLGRDVLAECLLVYDGRFKSCTIAF